MAITLKDIAKRAEVSVSTVSRIINNDTTRPASAETTARVWRIVHELNYVPNQTARQLIHMVKGENSTVKKKSIGCLVASCEDTFGDPFFSEVISGINAEIVAQGYVMEYNFPISPQGTMDAALFNNIVTRKVDGAVMLGRVESDMLKMLKSNIPHLVYCGLNYIDDDITQVICDAFQGIFTVVEYLISLGHKRIGFLGTTNLEKKLINERRYLAYEKAMKDNGMAVDKQYVCDVPLSFEGGYQKMSEIIRRGDYASAYCCANDVTAIGAMRAILEQGLKIPQDISITGFDDIQIANYTVPSLSTVHTLKEEMGKLAVRTLVDCIDGKSSLPVRINFPYDLVIRESCGAWDENAYLRSRKHTNTK